MKLYRFSPIKSEDKLIDAVKYVAIQTTKLCQKITGKALPIASLTIFAHYNYEYKKLIGILNKLGKLHDKHNGIRVILHKPIKIGGHTITHLRVRKPDMYRMQVGCNDFEIKNYQHFKRTYLTKHPQNLRLIERPEFEMIEFFGPDFDVLAYVVRK